MKTSTASVSTSPWPQKTICTTDWKLTFDEVYARQEAINEDHTEALRKASVLSIGAGGLASFMIVSLIRKGSEKLVVCDEDVVEIANLNRQHFFEKDLFQPKAFALAENAAAHSPLGCKIEAHRVDFGPNSAQILSREITLALVGVDNDQTRAFASRFFRKAKIPCIFTGVNTEANYGYCFVQKPDSESACLGCVFAHRMHTAEKTARVCTSSPATVDILQLVGALALYAVDSILVGRKIKWTFRDFNLIGGESVSVISQKRPDCPICGTVTYAQ